ncbi:phage tail tape measure protein [Phycicoccus duodecadis]|uniref:Phage-related minor tail protein n=1 Tax=Phycicoccus duodecadis TaxID=173053 RepID=A0A2N3YEX1_9MICO|nr:phage tail tape measure protein [Phycicoccus duodecadis]PKW25402.1 phage-related minor tail protein [Phycicoccus duodecadis]
MALNIGTLTGYLDLEAGPFERGLGSAMDKLRDLGPKGAKIAAAGGAAIGVAIGAALAGAMDVQDANAKLAAQLALSAPESAQAGKMAGDLYSQNYGDSLGQVNDAVRAVAQNITGTGTIGSKSMQDLTADVLSVSSAFDQDLGGTTAAVGQLMKTGLAKDATQALDIITRGFQQGTDKSGDLLDTFTEYSTVFRDIGISGVDATGLLQQGLKAGARDADTVGDALKELAIRGQDGSTTSAAGFKAIGLSASSMTAAFAKGGPAARAATDKVLDGLRAIEDPAKRNAAAVALFGTKAEDLGDSLFALDLDTAATGLGKVDGAAKGVSSTLGGTASSNIESFKRQAQQAFVTTLGGRVLPIVNTAAATLASEFGPALKSIGDWIMNPVLPSLQQLGQFISDNQTPIMVIAGLIAAVFIPHLIALGVQSVIAGTKAAAGWVMQQGAAIAGAAAHSLSVLRVVGGWVLMGVQSLLQAGRMAAAWFIALGPIGWAIAAIIGIAAIVIANWDTIKAWTIKAWAAVSSAVGSAVTWVKGAVATVLQWIVSAFLRYTPVGIVISHWGQIKADIGAAVSWVKGAIAWFGTLPGKFADWFGRANAAAIGKATQLVTFVKGLPGKILSGLGNIGGVLVQKGKDLITGLIDGAGSMLANLGRFFLDKVPAFIREPFKKALGINSPSRVMADLSRWIPLGVVEGINSTAGKVSAAMVDLVAPPTIPPIAPPRVLSARAALDPNVSRDAARGYAGGAQGREPVALDSATIAAIGAAVARVTVRGEISAGRLDRALGGYR